MCKNILTGLACADIDDKNLTYAHANVARNKLDGRIHVLDVAQDESLVPMERITAELGFQRYVHTWVLSDVIFGGIL